MDYDASLLTALRDFVSQQGLEKTYWIAFSGGMDSQVLLSLGHELNQQLPLRLRAIHINHGLSPQAADWAAHCAEICAQYHIPLLVEAIHLDLTTHESLEEMARKKRYAIFAANLAPGDMLLTAHHQEDQAETVLLQLFRGAGPKGLAAMPGIKPFAQGFHGRPLLQVSRALLQQYAEQQHLTWVEDESNQHTHYARNFIRHKLIPLLQSRWPTVSRTIARSAAHCAEAQSLLTEYAERCARNFKLEKTLAIKPLLALNAAQQRLVLRCWIEQQGYLLPSTHKITAILQQVCTAAVDRFPCVKWQGAEVRRYRDHLYLMSPLQPHDAQKKWSWDLMQPLIIPGIGLLKTHTVPGEGLRHYLPSVSVQFRQGGEVIHVDNRGHRTLKNCLQEWGVPFWERERIPLIFLADKLIAVVGYFLDADYVAKGGAAIELIRDKSGCQLTLA